MIKQWKNLLLVTFILEIVLLIETYIVSIFFKNYNFNIYPFICLFGTILVILFYPEKIIDKIHTKKIRFFLSIFVYVAVLFFLCSILLYGKNILIIDFQKKYEDILIILLIAFFEELICKKVVYKFLSKKMYSIFAIILSIIFFVINHQFFWKNWRWASYLFFGIISFTCYFLYPSIVLSITFHFLWNLSLLLLQN
ncbi:MAG: CPBP family intramembrane metalloprotease [Treponema sp.]|nr:CPBP family intramembrane metalloprotease [Treponema sp.]